MVHIKPTLFHNKTGRLYLCYQLRICETTSKLQYANHKKLFNTEKTLKRHKKDTKLSIKYWNLKGKNKTQKYHMEHP